MTKSLSGGGNDTTTLSGKCFRGGLPSSPPVRRPLVCRLGIVMITYNTLCIRSNYLKSTKIKSQFKTKPTYLYVHVLYMCICMYMYMHDIFCAESVLGKENVLMPTISGRASIGSIDARPFFDLND